MSEEFKSEWMSQFIQNFEHILESFPLSTLGFFSNGKASKGVSAMGMWCQEVIEVAIQMEPNECSCSLQASRAADV